jgi:hypothetical protein
MAGVGDPVDDPLVDAAKANPGLAVAVGTGVLVVARLLAVSNFNIQTALAVLASAGPGNVVLGAAITGLPYAAPVLGIALYDVGMTYYRSGRRAVVALSLAPLLIGAGLLLTPALVLVAILAAFIGTRLVVFLLRRRGRPVARQPDTPLGFWFTTAWPVLTIAALFAGPWLPAEAIEDGGVPVVGYVTSTDGTWTHVLTYQPRTVEYHKTDAITRRYLCEIPSTWVSKSVLDLVRTASGTACPAPS